jgi:hypothetical protein
VRGWCAGLGRGVKRLTAAIVHASSAASEVRDVEHAHTGHRRRGGAVGVEAGRRTRARTRVARARGKKCGSAEVRHSERPPPPPPSQRCETTCKTSLHERGFFRREERASAKVLRDYVTRIPCAQGYKRRRNRFCAPRSRDGRAGLRALARHLGLRSGYPAGRRGRGPRRDGPEHATTVHALRSAALRVRSPRTAPARDGAEWAASRTRWAVLRAWCMLRSPAASVCCAVVWRIAPQCSWLLAVHDSRSAWELKSGNGTAASRLA